MKLYRSRYYRSLQPHVLHWSSGTEGCGALPFSYWISHHLSPSVPAGLRLGEKKTRNRAASYLTVGNASLPPWQSGNPC
ncbi:unnamed protein product [Nezara viridula]|uniref:Uncharacterized protein n=1 Tax=Nezara viridula TaxID=85310 RepID=A0A9P0ECY1_NEZVI|nr:unnamed protein product [Nezara viridula]